MSTTNVTLEFKVLIDHLVQACNQWQTENIIDGHDVDVLNGLILLCGLAQECSPHSDYPCLKNEIEIASQAFLAKDFRECERHTIEVGKWKNFIDQELAEARAKRHKTSVK